MSSAAPRGLNDLFPHEGLNEEVPGLEGGVWGRSGLVTTKDESGLVLPEGEWLPSVLLWGRDTRALSSVGASLRPTDEASWWFGTTVRGETMGLWGGEGLGC